MNVFDYIEKELDRIEVGYTSYDGTKITLTMDDVRELVQNLKKKYKADGDVIYRQAAIDIVVFECDKWTGLAKEISKQLKQLPSAQPEPCEDTISRQAAIDALCAVCGNDCDKSEFLYNAPQDEQIILCPEHYVLTQLPSAQLDVTDINVGDMISRSAAIETQEKIMADHPLDGYEDGLLLINALNDLPSIHPEPQWIPCSERLPEGEYVLISKKPTKISGDKWCVTIAIRMADPRSRKVNWRDIGYGVIQDNEVLAWMPLPEVYKERREDERSDR